MSSSFNRGVRGLTAIPGKPIQGRLPSSQLPGPGLRHITLDVRGQSDDQKTTYEERTLQDRSIDRDAELLGGMHA